jgi:CheY-like chemotaxis protein
MSRINFTHLGGLPPTSDLGISHTESPETGERGTATPHDAYVTPEAAPVGRPRRLLYIEDDREVYEVTIDVLESAGYIVTHVDGDKAALAVYGNPYDAILSDVRLEGSKMNGPEIVRMVRQRNPQIPAVFLTGTPEDLDEELTPEERVSSQVLQKPISSIDLLLTTIEKNIRPD